MGECLKGRCVRTRAGLLFLDLPPPIRWKRLAFDRWGLVMVPLLFLNLISDLMTLIHWCATYPPTLIFFIHFTHHVMDFVLRLTWYVMVLNNLDGDLWILFITAVTKTGTIQYPFYKLKAQFSFKILIWFAFGCMTCWTFFIYLSNLM